MFWLSTANVSPELAPLAAHTRPWAVLVKMWRFCNFYGEYRATPPSLRRQFVIELEHRQQEVGSTAPVCCQD
ncbi:MAG: hypothetical protein AAF773_17490 [Cyanobacteria bacterium P01_D01_bin.115]